MRFTVIKRTILFLCLCFLLLAQNITYDQIAAGSKNGTDTKLQTSDGTHTNGNVPKYDSNNGLTDAGIAASAITQTICSGSVALGTSAISSGAKASTVTATCTGLATTDNIMVDFNADPTATTGYTASSNGILTIFKFPTTNTINIIVENNTGGSITPGAVTVNYRVTR